MVNKCLSRRSFLKNVGTAIVGVSVLPTIGCEFHRVLPIGEVLDDHIPFVTPISEFYEQYGAKAYIGGDWKMPDLTKDNWNLTMNGLGFEKKVSYSEIAQSVSQKGVTFLKTMRCVFDTFDIPGLVSTGIWKGVPLRDFLPAEEELVSKGVKRLHCFGADGFLNNVKLSRIFGERQPGELDVMLITEMNGVDLPLKHGGPVRMMVFGTYGYKNMKFIERIEFSEKDEPFGHYEKGNFDDDGLIQTVSKVTMPLTGSTVSPGKVKVFGVAFSGMDAIEKVEIFQDGNAPKLASIVEFDAIPKKDPQLAELMETLQVKEKESFPFKGVWALWEYEFDASPGPVELKIRATDKSGNSQPDEDTNFFDGGSQVTVLKFNVEE